MCENTAPLCGLSRLVWFRPSRRAVCGTTGRVWINSTLRADWSAAGLAGRELYSHALDPVLNISDFDSSENANLAGSPAYAAAAQALAAVLRRQFDA